MSVSTKEKEVQKLIAKEAAKATTIAALPIPILDLVGVVFVQVNMIEKLANIHGISLNGKQKIITTTIISTAVVKLITEFAILLAKKTNINKVFGQSMIEASIVGLSTGIVGEMYHLHFENGGTTDNINFDSFIEYIQYQIASDKLSVQNISKQLVGAALPA